MPGAIGLVSEYFLEIVNGGATRTIDKDGGGPWRGPCASSRIRASFGLTLVEASPRSDLWTSNEYAAQALLWVSNFKVVRR